MRISIFIYSYFTFKRHIPVTVLHWIHFESCTITVVGTRLKLTPSFETVTLKPPTGVPTVDVGLPCMFTGTSGNGQVISAKLINTPVNDEVSLVGVNVVTPPALISI